MSPRTSLSSRCICVAILLFGVVWVPSFAENISVDAQSNIFGAGHGSAPNPGGGGGGILPPVINLVPGHEKFISFSYISGTVGSWAGDLGNGPDGYYQPGNYTSIDSYGGIAGIFVSDRVFFLAGVYLDASEPADPAPYRLGYSEPDTQLPEYSPELKQVFFIGDGLGGTGLAQVFRIPAAASRLFLGFADGYWMYGPPGFYEDNFGSLSVSYSIFASSRIAKLKLTPKTVKGGRTVKGEIQLKEAAPSGGALILLTNNPQVLGWIAEIVVPAGKKTAKFQIPTFPVSSSQKVSIIAKSANTVSKTLTITK